MKRKAQISQEAITAAIVIFLVFVVVFAYVSQHNIDTVAVKDFYENKNLCNNIANQISYIYSTEKNSQTTIYIHKDFNVYGSYIEISDHSCYFHGTAQPAQLQSGYILIKSSSGVVTLENV